MFGIIYRAKNVENGKVYIGQTIQEMWARKSHHKFHADVKDNIFSRAIRKYGFDSFVWEVIDKANSREELNEKEVFWISHYNSHGVGGYNETDGGEGTVGYTVKDETKDKISQTRLERMDNYKHIKLNSELVKEIKILLMSELYTQQEIADKFGVKKNVINNIKCLVRWSSVFVDGFDEWSKSTNGRILRLDTNKKNEKVKLNKDKVLEIRSLFLEGKMSNGQIAEMYGVTKSTIEQIKCGRTWKHVTL